MHISRPDAPLAALRLVGAVFWGCSSRPKHDVLPESIYHSGVLAQYWRPLPSIQSCRYVLLPNVGDLCTTSRPVCGLLARAGRLLMQIEKPTATNKKNLTTDVNLEFIIKTSSEAEFCYYYGLLES